MQEKEIIEERQGEALTMPVTGKATGKLMYLESYGCAMNFSDSEIVASVLMNSGYTTTTDYHEADLILINTCAIRDNAEVKVRNRLKQYNSVKRKNPKLIVGVMGCMAERLKSQFLEQEKIVDIVVGPDAYRELPKLIETVEGGQKAVNVLLSLEETYADISPVRLGSNGVTAFISITRGCDNMCSFCVVPFTRGRERSREPNSIVNEAKDLFEKGYREVTLLGQNVDSYLWHNGKAKKELSTEEKEAAVSFAKLLEMVAQVNPELRVRFSTSNPQDMTDDVFYAIAKYDNIAKCIHLPIQSGSTTMLERMNRGYSRAKFLERVASLNKIIADCAITTDVISGFCGETEAEHADTLSLMNEVRFDFAYMFAYSERPGTLAAKKFKDDIAEEVKLKRLQEIIVLQQNHSAERVKAGLGKVHHVLVEGVSKKSDEMLFGRNSQNTVVVFPKEDHKKGEYVHVLADDCTPATLVGKVIS